MSRLRKKVAKTDKKSASGALRVDGGAVASRPGQDEKMIQARQNKERGE